MNTTAPSPAAIPDTLELFLVTAPGLEPALLAEAQEKGFADAVAIKGGVTVSGGWPEVWRANLELRGATRVLARIASFRALHLAQLDKRARRVAWGDVLRADVPVRVEASCKASRIYHAGATAQRVERAITETLGAPISDEAAICIKVRIDDDLCTISLDTSGESLHKRGHKDAIHKAPMRETLAAQLLRLAGYDGREPVVDPMCGSGTFVIEAAEIAAGLHPGRTRAFAFEQLASFDPARWERMRATNAAVTPSQRFFGSDRDGGAIAMSRANADKAGVADWVQFDQHAVSDRTRPDGPSGLVIVNPPYGARIGDVKSLFPLYQALGRTLLARFGGWRVAIVTSDAALARATGLPFAPNPLTFTNGGLRVALYTTEALPETETPENADASAE